MLPGYNHNVAYKGQTFHIQTEDSGVDHPHIITLLFVKGNIIARKKKEYRDLLNFERLDGAVRELMQNQHKEMLRELKTGKYDAYLAGTPAAIEEAPAPAPAARPTPAPAVAPRPAAPAVTPPRPAAPAVAPRPVAPAPPVAPRPTAPAVTTPRPTAPAVTTPRPTAPAVATPRPTAPAVAPRPAAPVAPRPVAPAPPVAARPVQPPVAPRPVAPRTPVAVAPPPPPPQLEPDEMIAEKPANKTITLSEDEDLRDEDIFGADLISARSLDEVILNFLSEQIDEDDD